MTYMKHCEGCKHYKPERVNYGLGKFYTLDRCRAKSNWGAIILKSVIDRCDREKLKEQR